jgi:hypothetical protein
MSNWQLIGRQEFHYQQLIDFLLCCVVGCFVGFIAEGSRDSYGLWCVEGGGM